VSVKLGIIYMNDKYIKQGIEKDNVKVLYSYPHKLGADRICYTAWQQVNGLSSAGADVIVFPGVLFLQM
jgi:hypothetical protein